MADPAWPIIESTIEYENPWFVAERDTVRRPDGNEDQYYRITTGDDDVVIVAVTDDSQIVLVEQYRPRLKDTFLECPAGAADGEKPPAAAERELREETGYRANSLELLTSYYPEGWVSDQRHIVYASDLEVGEASQHDGEFLEVCLLSVEDALEAVQCEPTVGWALTPLLIAHQTGKIS